MENEYVTQAIARMLRVKKACVGRWVIQADNNGEHIPVVGHLGLGVSGIIKTGLKVTLALERDDLMRLQRTDLSGVRVLFMQENAGRYGENWSLSGTTEVEVALLYSKETQHLFKALYQQMTVRGPQKRKKKWKR